MRRASLVFTLATLMTLVATSASSAHAGPPLDGPADQRGAPTRPLDPPAPLTDASSARSTSEKTWEERHEWEERGTLFGLLSGAAVGAGGVVALFLMLPRDDGASPDGQVAQAVSVGVLALYGGAMGAYAGGFLGAGVGMVIDAGAQ